MQDNFAGHRTVNISYICFGVAFNPMVRGVIMITKKDFEFLNLCAIHGAIDLECDDVKMANIENILYDICETSTLPSYAIKQNNSLLGNIYIATDLNKEQAHNIVTHLNDAICDEDELYPKYTAEIWDENE